MLFGTNNALNFPLLSLIVFLPLIGAGLIAILPKRHAGLQHITGLFFSGLVLVLSILAFANYDRGWANPLDRRAPAMRPPAFQLADPASPAAWLPGGVTFQLAVDGISITLVLLTALLGFIALLFSWKNVRLRTREYVALMLVLETGMLGVFTAMDLFLFYVFWEASLIPMYFLIGIWGGKRRIYATLKFVIYTMAGSALMLVAILATVKLSGSPSFNYLDLLRSPVIEGPAQMLLFAAFALAFAVKVPLFPFHTWLPLAHVQAPTAGSVLLAGVLLKLGGYGLIRLAIPLFPDAAHAAMPYAFGLAIIGIWYGAWVAFAQTDIKKLVAYSSVSHMGIVVAGIFSLNPQGMAGGSLQMINHGISTGALFLLVGMLYERAHTREIADFGGLWKTMPRFSALFLIVTFSSVGLPGTNGFVGEWLALLGTFRANMLAGALAAFGVVLGAAYMLWLFQRVFFGPTSALSEKMQDLDGMEMLMLAPLILLIFWIGIYPETFLGPIQESATAWARLVTDAVVGVAVR
jgi:NADH-quinone oxidoreductase subunit M